MSTYLSTHGKISEPLCCLITAPELLVSDSQLFSYLLNNSVLMGLCSVIDYKIIKIGDLVRLWGKEMVS